MKNIRRTIEPWSRIIDALMSSPVDIPRRIWIEQKYGLQPIMSRGKLSGKYIVLDEQKYLMYLLKFG
jgi:hypothetical protein